MLSDQLIGLATEHRNDLLLEADRRRLAARLPKAASLRSRAGTRLVSLGRTISGEPGDPRLTHRTAPTGKEVREWKPC